MIRGGVVLSGKTVAIGFAIAGLLAAERAHADHGCRPRALLITPTRELAAQVKAELEWLFHDTKQRILVVTGGTSIHGHEVSAKITAP